MMKELPKLIASDDILLSASEYKELKKRISIMEKELKKIKKELKKISPPSARPEKKDDPKKTDSDASNEEEFDECWYTNHGHGD